MRLAASSTTFWKLHLRELNAGWSAFRSVPQLFYRFDGDFTEGLRNVGSVKGRDLNDINTFFSE